MVKAGFLVGPLVFLFFVSPSVAVRAQSVAAEGRFDRRGDLIEVTRLSEIVGCDAAPDVTGRIVSSRGYKGKGVDAIDEGYFEFVLRLADGRRQKFSAYLTFAGGGVKYEDVERLLVRNRKVRVRAVLCNDRADRHAAQVRRL